MDYARLIVDNISCLFEILVAMFFFSAFRKLRVTKKTLALIVIVSWLAFAGVRTFSGNDNRVFLISTLLTFVVALCYDFKLHNALFMTVVISMIATLSEVVMSLVLTLSGVAAQSTKDNIYVYITGIIMSKFLTSLVVVIINKGKHKLFQSAKGNNFIGILLLPIASILIIFIFFNFFYQYMLSTGWKIISMIALLLLVATNVTIFYIVDRQYELISTKQKLKMSGILLENQKQYYDNIFESQQEIRRIRHDLKNIFMAVLADMDSGDIESARRIVKSQLSETEKSIDFSDQKAGTVIDSVIYSKQVMAKEHDIALLSTIKIRKALLINNLDMAVMLANLLDNAIEATQRVTSQALKKIDLTIMTDNDNLILTVSNPVVEDIDVNRIQTTKSDKKNHGFGLLSIKAIVEKYQGTYTIQCKDHVFDFTAVLNNGV